MPLSEVDRHAIEVIYKEKGWSADKIVREFPNKGWKRSTVYNLIKKIEATRSSERIRGSGRPRSARTEENLAAVMERAISGPGEPGTSRSENEIARELGISQASVSRAKHDIGIHTYTRMVAPRITRAARQRRKERASDLIERLDENCIPFCIFYDEKDLTLERPINKQNNKVCSVAERKRDVSPERLFHERSRFSRKIMVCGAVSYQGKSDLIVVDPQTTKINSDQYQSVLRRLLPSIRRLYPDDDWIFIQDSAPSHRSQSTQEFLVNNTPAFVAHDEWPPNSPDCNPLDFHVWNSLREKVYAGRREPFENLQELEAAAKAAWREISVEEIRRAVDQFLPRLHVVVDQDGGPIQHLMG